MTKEMTIDEQIISLVTAFKPFADAVTSALKGLIKWAEDNKELFEKINIELERIEKEKEGEIK
jgi:hypothetical protein